MDTSLYTDYINRKIRLKSWKGDYLHRPDQSQGITSWDTGIGNEWTLESAGDGKVRLKSWKGDYLHRADDQSNITSWHTGIGNEWTLESADGAKVKIKSWKGDYLHRPDTAQGITAWDTGIGNAWAIELVDVDRRHFAIYPGIGVARMGNSSEFFIGPETPGVDANWNESTQSFASFRDAKGRILRQGARFRVFEYDLVNAQPANFREVVVGADVVDIEWRVHLANLKASFYVFDGQNGAEDNYIKRSQLPANLQIKTDPDRTNLRNAGVIENRAARLNLDQGEKLITARRRETVELENPNQGIPIKSLGTLQVDPRGRLIVLGGYGQSGTTHYIDKEGKLVPEFPIEEYASNDTWFDDASDGSVKARVRLADGSQVDATAAWVMVGPPDFAPGIGNVVSLYDTLWDVMVRHIRFAPGALSDQSAVMKRIREQQAAWGRFDWKVDDLTQLPGYQPSFLHDIYPLIKHALGARDVHVSGVTNAKYHKTMMDWTKLSSLKDPESERLRKYIFALMRNPDAPAIEWGKMPRGLGDDYTSFDTDAGPSAKSLFSLTRVQYWYLHQWAAGNFVNDWPGTEPVATAKENLTPEELDLAAADNSVGGPFFPGIDVSWLIRCPELYSPLFPLRFDYPAAPESELKDPPRKIGALDFVPGFFSQQMALPWQADFYDCHKEREEDPDGNEYYFMWWAAHRPDDVYPSGKTTQERWVRLFDANTREKDLKKQKPEEILEPDDYYNHDRFVQMQENWTQLKFVSVRQGDRWEEEP